MFTEIRKEPAIEVEKEKTAARQLAELLESEGYHVVFIDSAGVYQFVLPKSGDEFVIQKAQELQVRLENIGTQAGNKSNDVWEFRD